MPMEQDRFRDHIEVIDSITRPMEQDRFRDHIEVIDSITRVSDTLPPSATARIPRIPRVVIETHDYEKYFVPKVVSIGPYHYGKEKLELVEKLKPAFTMKLLRNNREILESFFSKLEEPEMVQNLRNYYEENSTTKFSDMDFAKMMLLDCCFVLYYHQHIFGENRGDYEELNNHQIAFIHQDLFLLENQIPFEVVTLGMKFIEDFNRRQWFHYNKLFMYENIIAWRKPKRNWFKSIFSTRIDWSSEEEGRMMFDGDYEPNHLLHFLHRTLTNKADVRQDYYYYHPRNNYKGTFRNARELVRVGIRFKPSDTMSLAHIKFVKSEWWFSAAVELPPITVDDSTKPMLLNLIAHEMSSNDDNAWVTSYVCLLNSLIISPEDVEVLRNAGVLENSLGSDSEVAKLFNEIGTDLVPNNLAYLDAKNKIQRHYESRSNTLIYQLKLFSLFGVTSLVLSAVQTYFTIWSLKSECDDLCKFLKKNHHL